MQIFTIGRYRFSMRVRMAGRPNCRVPREIAALGDRTPERPGNAKAQRRAMTPPAARDARLHLQCAKIFRFQGRLRVLLKGSS
jgi:hypothetical protein